MTSCRWYKSAQSVVDAERALKWTVEHFGRTPCVSILCQDAMTMEVKVLNCIHCCLLQVTRENTHTSNESFLQ